MKQFLEKLKKKEDLSFEESKSAFNILMNGKATEAEIFDFLTLLSLRVKYLMKSQAEFIF